MVLDQTAAFSPWKSVGVSRRPASLAHDWCTVAVPFVLCEDNIETPSALGEVPIDELSREGRRALVAAT